MSLDGYGQLDDGKRIHLSTEEINPGVAHTHPSSVFFWMSLVRHPEPSKAVHVRRLSFEAGMLSCGRQDPSFAGDTQAPRSAARHVIAKFSRMLSQGHRLNSLLCSQGCALLVSGVSGTASRIAHARLIIRFRHGTNKQHPSISC